MEIVNSPPVQRSRSLAVRDTRVRKESADLWLRLGMARGGEER